MPGTVILKPIKANLLNDNHHFLKMDPYCSLSCGMQEISGKVCKNGGKTPQWQDQLIFKRTYEPYCTLQIKDKEFFKNDSTVGVTQIDLREIESQGKLSKWYKLGSNNNEQAGEILIEAVFVPDTVGSYKQLPQQQSYAYMPSSHKTYSQSLYPPNIYSPGKQSSLNASRPVSQMPMSEIYGYHNKDQLITYPHISHHLTREEYGKLHARNVERYQPTNRVVPEQKKPPTWEGYKTPEHLLPQEAAKTPEVEIKKGSTSEAGQDIRKGVSTVESLGTASAEKTNSSMDKASDTQKTPISERREVKEEVSRSPGVLTYYPMVGGVTYKPVYNEATYKPVYEWPAKPTVANKELEKEDVKNGRKLSANSGSTGEKSSKSSIVGSLGSVISSHVDVL